MDADNTPALGGERRNRIYCVECGKIILDMPVGEKEKLTEVPQYCLRCGQKHGIYSQWQMQQAEKYWRLILGSNFDGFTSETVDR